MNSCVLSFLGLDQLLESELIALIGYDPYAREDWNYGNSRNGSYFRQVKTQFGPIKVQVPIYSMNMIESINNMIKRKTKPKSEFPTEESLDNFLGVQAIGYNDRNAKGTHKGFGPGDRHVGMILRLKHNYLNFPLTKVGSLSKIEYYWHKGLCVSVETRGPFPVKKADQVSFLFLFN